MAVCIDIKPEHLFEAVCLLDNNAIDYEEYNNDDSTIRITINESDDIADEMINKLSEINMG